MTMIRNIFVTTLMFILMMTDNNNNNNNNNDNNNNNNNKCIGVETQLCDEVGKDGYGRCGVVMKP